MVESHQTDGTSEQPTGTTDQPTLTNLLTSLTARLVVGFFFFFAFLVGFWVGGTSLHDPDTCWLLAVGNWIAQNHSVPITDPFSFSMGDRPFIAYQWMTELLFFASYKLLGGYGLVGLTSITLLFAFIIIPLSLFSRWKSSMWAGVTVCIVAFASASFHSLARPEIITYLFLAIWFALLAKLRQEMVERATAGGGSSSIPVNIGLAGAFGFLMVLWANMHTGFVLALIALTAFVLVNTIEFVFRKLPVSALATSWVALILAVVAPIVNPYGIGLWNYLPNRLFFTGFNRYIDELQPLGFSGLLDLQFLPSLLLTLCVIAAQVFDLRRSLKGAKVPVGIAFSPILTIAALVGGTIARRIIPFSCVFLACEIAFLLRGTGQQQGDRLTAAGQGEQSTAAGEQSTTAAQGESQSAGRSAEEAGVAMNHPWWREASDKVGSLLSSGTWPQMALALSLFGVFVVSTRVMAPDIPQNSSFTAPWDGIKFIAKSAPEGKCLNDPQYGDMMIWYLHTDAEPLMVKDPRRNASVEKRPKVFIDTRFDMYGSEHVRDYFTIAHTEPGWRERFAKYDFDWAFLPSNWKIANALRDEGWKPIFDDKIAVILVKPK